MIVYLDSQDFSRMANPPAGQEGFYQNLEAELHKLVASGAVEIRYSAVHISEITHTSVRAATFSAGRADALKRLCAGRCMRMGNDILEDEIEHYLVPAHLVVSTSEHDHWLDVSFGNLDNFLEMLKASLQENLREKGVNRKARRAVAKVDLARLLTQTDKGVATLDTIVENLNRKFPIEKELDRLTLVAYITGSIGRKKFLEYMRSIMADPVSLIARIAPEFDQSFKLPAIVRNQSQILLEKVNPAMDKIAKFLSNLSKQQIFQPIREEMMALPARIMRDVRRSSARQLLSDFCEQRPGLSRAFADDEIDQMPLPALDVLFGALTKYVSDVIASAEAGKPIRTFKQSDGADLLHATYIPYVSIFRCDTAWTDILRPQGARFGTTIVGRIQELLPAIASRLGST